MSRSARNPFTYAPGSLPSVLAGRAGEISAFENALAAASNGDPPNPLVFTGLRGMGKTALLRYCANLAEQRGAVVLRLEAAPDETFSDEIKRVIGSAQHDLRGAADRFLGAIRSLRPRYDLPSQPGETGSVGLDVRMENASVAEMLEALNVAAWKNDRVLLLTIDEIQSGDPALLRPIVKLVHSSHGTNTPVVFVAAGLPQTRTFITQEVRTYTERFDYYELGLLSRDDVKEAIARPLREQGVRVDPAALDLLADASGGYPDFVQRYASAAWLHHAGEHLTREDADATIPGVQKQLDRRYEGLLKPLAPREKAYVLALADLGPGTHTVGEVADRLGGASSAAFSSTRAQLVKKEVIVTPAPSFVEFRLPLTERYVQEHRAEFERAARARSVTRADVILHGAREDVMVSGSFEGVKKQGSGEIALVRAGDEYHGFRNVGAFGSVETGSEVCVRQRNRDSATEVAVIGTGTESGAMAADAAQRDGYEL